MHQILSYQTAMRSSDERNVREYITKRICISFVFSIGFFTLIAGKIFIIRFSLSLTLSRPFIPFRRLPAGQVRGRPALPDQADARAGRPEHPQDARGDHGLAVAGRPERDRLPERPAAAQFERKVVGQLAGVLQDPRDGRLRQVGARVRGQCHGDVREAHEPVPERHELHSASH